MSYYNLIIIIIIIIKKIHVYENRMLTNARDLGDLGKINQSL